MNGVLPFLVIGITDGSIYALAALGLVLTYKTSGVFNFAHGTLSAVAAFLLLDLRERAGLPTPVAVLLTLVLAGVVGGFALERLADRLSSAPVASRVVATVGLLLGLQALIVIRFGPASRPFASLLPLGTIELAGVTVRYDQIIVALLAAVSAAALYVFFRRTQLGIAMQAVVDDPVLLALKRTGPVGVRRWSWVIGSSFAAASGMLLASTVQSADSVLLTLLVVQAFGAAAVGAFTSLPLTYAGAIAIGVMASLSRKWIGNSQALVGLPTSLPFIVLFVALLVTPRARLVERGARMVKLPTMPRPVTPRAAVAGCTALVAMALVLPHLDAPKLPVFTGALVFVILFASLGLLVHGSGQVSLCHMAFAAVGASTFAHAAGAGVPWALAVLVGGFVAVPVGAVVAIPAIRLSGVYLAIATFGLGILVERLFYISFLMFGLQQRLDAPRPGVEWLRSDLAYYHLVLVAAIGCCGAVMLVRRSRLGRLLRGLAESPPSLVAHGTDTNVTRVLVFCISAFVAGIAGALSGPVTGSASGPSFTFIVSLLLLAVLAIAGRRPILAPVVAAVLYRIVPAYVDSPAFVDWLPVLFGIGAIAAVTIRLGPLAARVGSSERIRGRVPASRIRARPVETAGARA